MDRGVTEERLHAQRHKRRHKELPVPLVQLKLFPALAKVHRVEPNEAAAPREARLARGRDAQLRAAEETRRDVAVGGRAQRAAGERGQVDCEQQQRLRGAAVGEAGGVNPRRAAPQTGPAGRGGDRSGPSAYVYRDDSESKVVQRWRALQNERYKEYVAGGGEDSSSRFYTPQAVVRGSPRRKHKEDKRPPFQPASKRAAHEAISQTFRHDYNQGSRYSYERAEKQREAEERKKWIDPAGFRTALSAAGASALIENQRFIMAPEPDQRRSEVLAAKRKGEQEVRRLMQVLEERKKKQRRERRRRAMEG